VAFAIQNRPAYLAGIPYGAAAETIELSSNFIKNALGLASKTIPVASAVAYAKKLETLGYLADVAGKNNDAKKLREEAARLRALAPAGRAQDGSYVSSSGRSTGGGSRPADTEGGNVVEVTPAATEGSGVAGWVGAAVALTALSGLAWWGSKKLGYRSNPRKRSNRRGKR